MFGIKKLKKDFGSNVLGDGFIDDLSLSKEKVRQKKEESESKYEEIMTSGLNNLKVFTAGNGKNPDFFHKAADDFYAALKIRQKEAKPYFYLAWMFQLIDETDTAREYMEIAFLINPELTGLEQLKEELYS